jgi:hypothetical protein
MYSLVFANNILFGLANNWLAIACEVRRFAAVLEELW